MKSRLLPGPMKSPLPLVLPAVPVVIGAWILVVYSVGQWRAMTVPSWDLAIFSELAKAYSRLEAPIVPIKGDGYNLLGDHFHPILVLLGPVWRLFPSPLALLIVQDLLIAVSAWPITRLAVRLLGGPAGTVLGLFYVLAWGFQGAVAAQFHEIAFAVPMLAWGSVAFVESRWRACVLWIAPLVLVKEDLGLTVFMAGLAIALRGWQDSPGGEPQPGRTSLSRPVVIGLGLAAFGAAAFALTVGVILPALSPTGTWEYGLSGDGAAGGNLLARLLTPSVKIATLAMVACTAGLIGLASPWAGLVLPTLAWRLASSKEFYWDWQYWHYNAILIPVAVGALLDVVARLKGRSSTGTWMGAPVRYRWAVALAVAVPLATGAATASQLPLWDMTVKGYGSTSSRAAAAEQIIDLIPEGSTVETDLTLLAYLVPTTTVSWVGTSSTDTDYVVVDSLSSAWGGNPPSDAAQWATDGSTQGARYELVLDVDGFQVAKRVE
ncbi:DUF2079 domain-containing protein [Actinomyces howellii]|uniref:Predicted membrane protein n=1 Tax=Actinomyces howellii TaxID=52771 RepID=A0A448HHJ5_9ACTO|nr:DUF2079 domain-containing protein [Actinomyces howellii]VEG28644.1 Predicted membrane protein [Actinomyces howellii]